MSTADARAARILERLDILFRIGLAAGTNRPGLGAGEQQAHDLVRGWMTDAGLDVTVDPAGNLVGRLAGGDPGLAEVWTGSHLDTPPDGGRFDGALGVLAALDAVTAIGASARCRRTLAVIAFRLEEGPRFGRGLFGSRAAAGMLGSDEAELRDVDGITLGQAFAALGLGALPTAGWLQPPPHCFIEPHIEQGPTLAAAGVPLGVVTSIAAMAGLEITFTGRRGHAGTTPMVLRADALGAAARCVLGAHAAARDVTGGVATIGRLGIYPGATNTIPERVELFADLRAPDDARLDQLTQAVHGVIQQAAREAGCSVEAQNRWHHPAEQLHPDPSSALRRAAAAAGIATLDLPSGAGHDAAVMTHAGVPAAMLFVRSDAGGISHAPQEHTGADAVAACVAVLEPALRDCAA